MFIDLHITSSSLLLDKMWYMWLTLLSEKWCLSYIAMLFVFLFLFQRMPGWQIIWVRDNMATLCLVFLGHQQVLQSSDIEHDYDNSKVAFLEPSNHIKLSCMKGRFSHRETFIPFFLNSSIYYTVKEQKNWGLIASSHTYIYNTGNRRANFSPFALSNSCCFLSVPFEHLSLFLCYEVTLGSPEWLLMLFRIVAALLSLPLFMSPLGHIWYPHRF